MSEAADPKLDELRLSVDLLTEAIERLEKMVAEVREMVQPPKYRDRAMTLKELQGPLRGSEDKKQ